MQSKNGHGHRTLLSFKDNIHKNGCTSILYFNNPLSTFKSCFERYSIFSLIVGLYFNQFKTVQLHINLTAKYQGLLVIER